MPVDVRIARATGAVLIGLTLTACASTGTSHDGSHSGTSSAVVASSTANASDVTFAQMMIPHHQQAVEMSELAAAAGASAQVQALADEISAAQGPEIAQMQAMLDRWGAEQVMDHSGHQMDGMVSDADMDRLRAASGSEFDRLYVELMIAHHEGAIAMTDDPMANGSDPELRSLLETIVATQSAEIEQMRGMLAGS